MYIKDFQRKSKTCASLKSLKYILSIVQTFQNKRKKKSFLNFAPKTHHSLQQTKSDHERTEYCSSAVKASGGLSLSAAARARCVVVFVEAALAKLLLSRLFYFYSLLHPKLLLGACVVWSFKIRHSKTWVVF